ncbi:MAG: TetR/AcrR family transcriptional regulator [Ktedonobacteraceae bacterium]|nr:TetR/AcrR family transcriptional regulator [Ktedonobacteraceae bacterium]
MKIHHSSSTSAASAFSCVRRRPGGRSARVQAAVFEATIQLLQEQGYEALSFASIAARAGVHETSLYRRWKTKEQLVLDAVSSQVERDFSVPDTGSFRSDLLQLVQYMRDFLLSSVGQVIVQMAIASRHAPGICGFHKGYWQRRRPYLQPLFDRAAERGELPPQADCQLIFEMLLGVLCVRDFVLEEPLDETLPERIVDLVLTGVSCGQEHGRGSALLYANHPVDENQSCPCVTPTTHQEPDEQSLL